MTQSLRDYFTRPHRQAYYPFDLGPTIILASNRKCIRQDFHILNKSSHKLAVSFFHSPEQQAQNCVVYLHTHNGSKLEALPLAQTILSLGINLCLFDFAGYGNSEGASVTLGCRQMWDVDCVLSHLKQNYNQFQFILWGRSMGAVAALLYLAAKANQPKQFSSSTHEQSIIGGIYDSPFQSLEKLTLQIGSKSSKLPQFMVAPLVYLVKNSLKEDIDFDDLQLTEKMKHIKIPGIFITSHHDSFVHHSHSEQLYRDYGGKKELIYIEKDHNQIRKEEDLVSVIDFIKKLHSQYPKRWQSVLLNNLHFQRKNGVSVNDLYAQFNCCFHQAQHLSSNSILFLVSFSCQSKQLFAAS